MYSSHFLKYQGVSFEKDSRRIQHGTKEKISMKTRHVFNKRLPLLFLITTLLLTACSKPYGVANQSVDLNSDFCRGFDFEKEFGGRQKRPYSVNYDEDRKQLYNKDGLYYYIFWGDGRKPVNDYTEDLEISSREQRYIAAYDKREEEFDKKYTLEIKKKLVAISKKTTSWDGTLKITYPGYLEGIDLPEGLQSPATYFSHYFISDYVEEEYKPNDLRKFVESTARSKFGSVRELSGAIAGDIAGQIQFRMRSVYAEYVLTHYYLKQYTSAEERNKVALDMAEYYSDVAFRAAAEAMYESKHVLSPRQMCKVANHVSDKVYDLIMIIDDPYKLSQVKQNYKKELDYICYSNLNDNRIPPSNGRSKKEMRKILNELRKKVERGELRCIND